ncbi:MAG: Ldh family oxidoreductase [Sphaerochaeta sp.]|nr:Ldh family oxidoreductase [Sphaerochaeta sp.]
MNEIRIDAHVLSDYVLELFQKAGLSDDDAKVVADCIVQTNLWGVDSHGLLRAGVYLDRVEKKIINPKPEFKVIKDEDGPVVLLDGDAGLGYIVGKKGMAVAIERAKRFGIGFVLVRNSNHFGAAALYTRMATDVGLMSIVSTNVVPNIGMKGSVKPSTGNNPIALGMPLTGNFPFSLDISMSAVSGGKLLLAAKNGEKIPKDWAVTKEGEETDDPEKGFAGFLLPMGMHKGWGMSLFVDAVTGILSGGPFLQNLRSMYKNPDVPSLTSHLFCVIDPHFFLSEEDYKERVASWEKMIHETQMAGDAKPQVIPGEIEYLIEKERLENGIPISIQLQEELVALGKRLGIDTSAVE